MLGGPVYYLGVEVGAVTAMTIIPGDPIRVQVDIEVLESTPANAGTFASLALQGITGVSIINLSGDPGVHEPLRKQQNQSNPVIKVRDVGFSALLSKAPDVMNQLANALQQINLLLGEKNRAFVGSILQDLATVANSLAAKQEEIGELPGMLNKTLQEIRDGVSKLESAANDNEMNAFMEDGLGQVPALISEARNTLRELEKLVKALREDPSRLIYKPAEDAVEVEQP